jgi:hypothetical protein
MKNKSQNHAKARPVARSEELKHSVSTVAVHKNLADARIIFGGQCGRKFQNAFCFIMKHLPVCLRAGFQVGGRINGSNKKTLCSINELCLLKTS